MRDFLKDFHDATKFIEGREATINRVLFMLNFLMQKFEFESFNYEFDFSMILSIDSGYKKLQKYWNIIISRNSIYIAAIVLDFRHKWSYFQH